VISSAEHQQRRLVKSQHALRMMPTGQQLVPLHPGCAATDKPQQSLQQLPLR